MRETALDEEEAGEENATDRSQQPVVDAEGHVSMAIGDLRIRRRRRKKRESRKKERATGTTMLPLWCSGTGTTQLRPVDTDRTAHTGLGGVTAPTWSIR